MAPRAERAIQLEALFDRRADAIVRGPHPVEARRREAQDAVVAQHATAFAEQIHRRVQVEMLDEMLREDEPDVAKRKAARHVEHAVHAGITNIVDVDPALEDLRAGADVETLGALREEHLA